MIRINKEDVGFAIHEDCEAIYGRYQLNQQFKNCMKRDTIKEDEDNLEKGASNMLKVYRVQRQ